MMIEFHIQGEVIRVTTDPDYIEVTFELSAEVASMVLVSIDIWRG
jgi:hypothetical protein